MKEEECIPVATCLPAAHTVHAVALLCAAGGYVPTTHAVKLTPDDEIYVPALHVCKKSTQRTHALPLAMRAIDDPFPVATSRECSIEIEELKRGCSSSTCADIYQ